MHMFKCEEKSKITRTLVIRDECIEESRSVGVGLDGRLHVARENTNSIVHVSASGIIIGSFQLNMIYPCVLCLSKDGRRKLVASKSAVGETKGETKLQLFVSFFSLNTYASQLGL